MPTIKKGTLRIANCDCILFTKSRNSCPNGKGHDGEDRSTGLRMRTLYLHEWVPRRS